MFTMKNFEDYTIEELQHLRDTVPNLKKLGELFNLSESAIKSRLRRLGVHKHKITIAKDELFQLYITENKTMCEIAKIKNVKLNLIKDLCQKYNFIKSSALKSAIKKQKWKEEEFRERMINGIRIARSTLESRNKTSDISKENWKNEKYRENVVNSLKKNSACEEQKKKRSQTSKENWKNKDYRDKISNARKNTWKNENFKQERSERAKEQWQRKEFRDKVITSRKIYYSNSEVKRNLSEKRKEYYKTHPDLSKKLSEIQKKNWELREDKLEVMKKSFKGTNFEEYCDPDLFETKLDELKTLDKMCKYFNVFHTTILNRVSVLNLKHKLQHCMSNLENDLNEFVSSIYKGMIQRNKRIYLDSKYEIDIFLPEIRLGIEFNGSYWHSLEQKNRNYHFEKALFAKEKNIRLIQIWECDWNNDNKQKIIKNLLNNVINGNNEIVYARKCEIRAIDTSLYKAFCEQNHIQGYQKASVKLGLFYNNELVQIASFAKGSSRNRKKTTSFETNFSYEWIRLCTKNGMSIIGGVSRLFNFFIKMYSPETILSYSNLNLFTGDVYEKLGFEFVGYTGPDLFFIDKISGNRINRCASKHALHMEKVKSKRWFMCYGAGSKKFVWKK